MNEIIYEEGVIDDLTKEKLDDNQQISQIMFQSENFSIDDEITREGIHQATVSRDKACAYGILFALQKIGIFDEGKKYTLTDMREHQAIIPQYRWLLKHWTYRLFKEGLISKNPDHSYTCKNKTSEDTLIGLWNKAKFLLKEHMGMTEFVNYIENTSRNTASVIDGSIDPISILYPEGKEHILKDLYENNLIAKCLNKKISEVTVAIVDSNPNRTFKILEIGAGSGATSSVVLEGLKNHPNFEYYFTDIAKNFIPNAKNRFKGNRQISYQILDIDKDYRMQGFSPKTFDIIIAAGVVENAKRLKMTMGYIEDLLVPNGWFLFTAPTEEELWILASQAFLMTKPVDELREHTTYMEEKGWLDLLKIYGGDGNIYKYPLKDTLLDTFKMRLFVKKFI